MRVCIHNNQSIFQIINNTDGTIHYTPQLSMGIVVIRSLAYYNVTKSIMSFDKRGNNKIPPPPYTVLKLHPHNYYNTSQLKHSGDPVGNAKSSEQAVSDPYSWLDSDDPRRDMADEEILDQ